MYRLLFFCCCLVWFFLQFFINSVCTAQFALLLIICWIFIQIALQKKRCNQTRTKYLSNATSAPLILKAEIQFLLDPVCCVVVFLGLHSFCSFNGICTHNYRSYPFHNFYRNCIFSLRCFCLSLSVWHFPNLILLYNGKRMYGNGQKRRIDATTINNMMNESICFSINTEITPTPTLSI